MIKKPIINTGEPRSVTGHVVSGAVASAIVSGAVNYQKFQNGDMEKSDAIRDTLKTSAQGGIATGAAISTANHIGNGDWFKAISSMSMGIAGIYAVEVVNSQIEQSALENDESEDGLVLDGEPSGDSDTPETQSNL